MPAVLWEGCFLSDYEESKWVTLDETRQQMAQAIACGVLDFFDIKQQPSDSLTLEQRVTNIERHLSL